MKHVFGPVPSRRLGRSLGIDPVPLKTCNWNCVYCQLGRTRPLINRREEYISRQEILVEVQKSLETHPPGEIDWITFVGSGEPTLHSGLGWLIRQVQALTSLPVAVITNGSLLHLSEVRADLAAAEAVLPTLDAGDALLYRRINRPHPACSYERLIEGLTAFRKEYTGKLWIEVMLVRGLNDSLSALRRLSDALKRIQPDRVHIVLPTRPPAETWVQPPTEEGLINAQTVLGEIAQVVSPFDGAFDLSGFNNLDEAILAIVTRHPMRKDELVGILGRWLPEKVDQELVALECSDRIQVVERMGVRFYCAKESYYPNDGNSLRAIPKNRQGVR